MFKALMSSTDFFNLLDYTTLGLLIAYNYNYFTTDCEVGEEAREVVLKRIRSFLVLFTFLGALP